MNALIAWGNKLRLGVPAIDDQHRELIRLANVLYTAMKAGKGKDVLNQLFIDLANYTVWHFGTEESMMAAHGFPGAAGHGREHAELKQMVAELAGKAKGGQLEITLETMNFLRDWLSHHIQHTDRALADFLLALDGRTPPRNRHLRLVVNND